jgi:hypothetical protein
MASRISAHIAFVNCGWVPITTRCAVDVFIGVQIRASQLSVEIIACGYLLPSKAAWSSRRPVRQSLYDRVGLDRFVRPSTMAHPSVPQPMMVN